MGEGRRRVRREGMAGEEEEEGKMREGEHGIIIAGERKGRR